MELLNFPEETVVEICKWMNNATLANFARTSSYYRRICNEFIQKELEKFITRIILDLKNSPLIQDRYNELELYSTGIIPRRFSFTYFPHGVRYRDEGPFSIDEILIIDQYVFAQLGLHSNTIKIGISLINEEKVQEILKRLISGGYVTKYKLINKFK